MRRAVGARPSGDSSTSFVVWAPEHERVEVHLLEPEGELALERGPDGYHCAVAGCGPGRLYRYRLPDGRELADPASRSQPEGVHGPSQVVDLAAHSWGDAGYRARPLWDQVLYELHVGTFTSEGTFDAAVLELDDLVRLGVSAIEIMPVAQFPGRRNWGYDGVFPFAVQDSYGGYGGLQRLVGACHERGLAVVLDVVYNHLGPEGNVLGTFAPYFTDRYATPWGKAVNFDGPGSDEVRSYFTQNAEQWFSDFHVDALRLDAVHEIIDRNATTFLAELARHTSELSDRLGSRFSLIAESADNDPRLVSPPAAGGFGLDAQWNDDFHHALHAVVTGERFGYYADFGTPEALARAMDNGFVYQGEYSRFRRRRHGAPSAALDPEHFVIFSQNHDHIGNRPRGDRLVTTISPAQASLVAAIVMLAPGIPLLFMGEEYGETAPFPYFIDHGDPSLVEAVRRGRAAEFASIAEKGQLFDPAAESTFAAARIDRSLGENGEHRALIELYRDLIALRRTNPALRRSPRGSARAKQEAGVVSLERTHPEDTVVALFNVTGVGSGGEIFDPSLSNAAGGVTPWTKLLGAGPAQLGSGERLALGPWEFAVYHLGPRMGSETKGTEK
jgi:maltooligosyltrehalose trehalohydrolase